MKACGVLRWHLDTASFPSPAAAAAGADAAAAAAAAVPRCWVAGDGDAFRCSDRQPLRCVRS